MVTDLEKCCTITQSIQPLHSQARRPLARDVSTYGKNFPFGFSGVDDCWETYPSALMDIILCLTTIFAALLVLSSVNEAILVRAKTTVRTFSNFNLLCGHCTLLPFPSALMSLCAPGRVYKKDDMLILTNSWLSQETDPSSHHSTSCRSELARKTNPSGSLEANLNCYNEHPIPKSHLKILLGRTRHDLLQE